MKDPKEKIVSVLAPVIGEEDAKLAAQANSVIELMIFLRRSHGLSVDKVHMLFMHIVGQSVGTLNLLDQILKGKQ
jgi:hypothetical protein